MAVCPGSDYPAFSDCRRCPLCSWHPCYGQEGCRYSAQKPINLSAIQALEQLIQHIKDNPDVQVEDVDITHEEPQRYEDKYNNLIIPKQLIKSSLTVTFHKLENFDGW